MFPRRHNLILTCIACLERIVGLIGAADGSRQSYGCPLCYDLWQARWTILHRKRVGIRENIVMMRKLGIH